LTTPLYIIIIEKRESELHGPSGITELLESQRSVILLIERSNSEDDTEEPRKPGDSMPPVHLKSSTSDRSYLPMSQAQTHAQSALRAFIVHSDDNVANLVGPGQQGQSVECAVHGANGAETIELLEAIPSNHKFARRDIESSEPIIKYGLSIGTASKTIKRGEHVHTHNIESNRGRGDLRK
jgi:hypothetical protein